MNDPNYMIHSMKSAADNMNNLTYTDYLYRLMLISRSVFKWNNLPNGIDEKWIEQFLYHEGKCLFFEDKEKGFMVAKCNPSGSLNYYDEPTKLIPFGTGYTGKSLVNNEDCVLIRNNDIMIPTKYTIQLYALRLAEVTRAMDVNINAQKTPLVVLCNDKKKFSFKKIFSQITGNEPAIFGDKSLNPEDIKTLNTEAPVVFDKLNIQKNNIWNECMSFLGVNNANMDKRERLVADEVSANDEQIAICGQTMLKAREKACELINERFGTNISVEFRIQPDREVQKVGEEE